ncbi:aminotransferase class I/II-fold pyridoxal phosphate-dependent enzyme [Bombilactobacillus thymidiniphilus]|uniref:Aminotransferase n=1 Tax=Bombilactobacillus thymidiniphilus TaxID=2923363 RepID=A0ABY4PC86_9LACO|nr:aminotransferase class I/II-fold pyridoxal phosphate-dependent enzyme [Bombilactobacillus thymidiniphilus]UQS83169.1 aminotransferase class I/II-fold pyridoxal phosphate-dependent enzyme [Bombilactobacillus thymidiniphilus]
MFDMEQRMNTVALQIKPQDIFLFNARALKTPGIINMTVGEPNFATPEHIRQHTSTQLLQQTMHYTIPEGKPALTAAIANFLHDKYDLNYDPSSQIIATLGVTESVYTTLAAILNPGDEVIVPTPSFTIYGPDIILNQAKPVFVDTSKTNFRLDPAMLRATLQEHPRAKALILNYPNNPTGITYDKAQLQALAEVLQEYAIFVISDEIYSELSYAHKHVSFATLLPEQTILLNGLSKSHAMTGWRVGYICGPQKVIAHILHVHELITTSIPEVTQDAAIEALTNGQDDTHTMSVQYQKRRDILYNGLQQLGFKVAKPQGAFYIFAKIPAQLTQDDVKLAEDLIAKEKLALLPGSFFGIGGAGYLRISYAASLENIKITLTKLQHYLVENGVETKIEGKS